MSPAHDVIEPDASDAVVIGGGHNGLVCAALLAKSGRKVLVLEAASEIGGAARTEEFAPGFRVSSMAHVLNRLHPEVVKALDLESHGLNSAPCGACRQLLCRPEASR